MLASIAYSYKHGFSGFAAMLTEDQAEKLAGWMVFSYQNLHLSSLLNLALTDRLKMENLIPVQNPRPKQRLPE